MSAPPHALGADPPTLTMLASIARSLHLVRPLEDWLTRRAPSFSPATAPGACAT